MTHRSQLRTCLPALLCLAVLAWTGVAAAQMPIPDAASQFDITGFLQEATLNNPADPLSGGTLKINGHNGTVSVIVPANTIVIFPANALTWQEIFAQAPAPWGIPGNPGVTTLVPTTGMAMADCANATVPCTAPPLTTYEVEVVGNKAPGTATGTYIAGLVYVAQEGLNQGQGYITNIDYVNAELQIATLDALAPVARVKINDPVVSGTTSGRYSIGLTPDKRFTVDQDNPTIASGTGFPMCLPRAVPPAAGGAETDPLCPQGNRPVDINGQFAGSFTMVDPATFPIGTTGPTDPRVQAPFEIGDFITYAGTLVKDPPAGGVFAAGDGPTVGPWPAAGTSATYVSAHTVNNNIAIYTFPNTNPAYATIDVFILGTGGLVVLGAQEPVVRTRFEGFSTDPSRIVHLYALDLPCAADLPPGTSMGACDRDWGTIGVDPGPPSGAVKGRWRFRPPCAPFGTVPTKPDKQCVMNAAGTFLPPTREVRAVIAPTPGTAQLPAWVPGQTTTYANGIIAGQYHAPILDYIFIEQIIGSPVPPANFDSLPFLALGGYTSSAGTTAPGPLNPWPGATSPCTNATASALASPTTVISPTPPNLGALVTLSATASGTGPFTYAWTQNPTDNPQVTLTGADTATATFNAPSVAANTTLSFTVKVTNCNGVGVSTSSPVTVTITVDLPFVNQVTPITVSSGVVGFQVPVSGGDPLNLLPLTFAVTQSGGNPALPSLTIAQGANPPGNTATITLSAPTLPLGTITPDVVNLAITATNTGGAVSPTQNTTVTVNPPADLVTVTAAQYRTSKQRLTINASDSIISPNIVLTLGPYLCQGGASLTCPGGIFTPTASQATFAPAGAGLYLLDVLGLPEPACNPPYPGGTFATPCSAAPMTIQSNIPGGGTAAPFALTSIRQ